MQDSGHIPQTAAQGDADAEAGTRPVERHLLELFVCPLRKTMLIYDRDAQELISPAANLAYPIRDGVPMLSEGCARALTDADRHKHRIK